MSNRMWLGLSIQMFFLFSLIPSARADSAYIIPLKEVKEATNSSGKIRIAKIIKGNGPTPASPNLSSSENFGRFANLVGMNPKYYLLPNTWFSGKALGNDVEKEKVIVSYQDGGKTVSKEFTTDDEGHVVVDPSWIKGKNVTISMAPSSKYKATPKTTTVFSVQDPVQDTLYFTDHDDTVKFTGVVKTDEKKDTDGDLKRKKSKEGLIRAAITNPYDWHAFPGAAALSKAITEGSGKKVPMMVVTGSPAFLGEDISNFYKINNFPTPEAIHLRNLKDLGKEEEPDPSDALRYKSAVFEKILDGATKKGALKTVIFDGDRGEKDPEVALAMAKKYPNVKFIVGIQNITSDAKSSARFAELKKLKNVEFVLYDNKYEFAKVLYDNGKITKAALENVAKSVEENNQNLLKDVAAGKIKKKKSLFSLFPSRKLSLEEMEKNHIYLPKFTAKGVINQLGGM